MPIWLLSALPVIWHAFKRFASVILIAIVVIGGPYFLYRLGYNKGFKAAYKDCSAKPTYTMNGPTTIIQPAKKLVGFAIGKIYLGAIKE